MIIKPNQILSFTGENNIDYEAEIMSRIGKSTGKYSKWYNIKYSPSNSCNASGTLTWIDLSKKKTIIPERAVSSSLNNHHTSNNILSDQYVNHNSQSKECNIQENSLVDEIYVYQIDALKMPKKWNWNHGRITMFSKLSLT